jgi:hypothetical protein
MFGSDKAIAKEEIKEGDIILSKWRDYVDTVPEKKEIIAKLPSAFGGKIAVLKRLRELLTLEMVDIHVVEKDEDDMIKNLEALEHSGRRMRLDRLEASLAYEETKLRYIHNLMIHLYVILKSEWSIVENLFQKLDITKYSKKVGHLTSELELETEVLRQISLRETFNELFVGLVNRDETIEYMDANEKRLLRTVQKRMNSVFAGEIKTGVTYQWALNVFKASEIKVDELFEANPYGHEELGFEFVNSAEFIPFVIKWKPDAREKEFSDEMVKVFVHAFREWYNHREIKS